MEVQGVGLRVWGFKTFAGLGFRVRGLELRVGGYIGICKFRDVYERMEEDMETDVQGLGCSNCSLDS